MRKGGDFGRLRVLSGPDAGVEFAVADGLVCGRGPDCGLRLSDTEVSKQHFRIAVGHGKVEIQDLGSSNGTRVNDRQVTTAALAPGDKIEIGGTVMRYERSGFRRPLPRGVTVTLLVVLVAGAVAFWLWQSAAARRQKELDTHLHWAREFEKQHAYTDALYEYRILSEIAPRAGYQRKVDEMTGLGTRDRSLARVTFVAGSGEYERAAAMLDSLLSDYPDDPEIRRLAADVRQGRERFMLVSQVRALRDQKQYDRALAVLDSAGPTLGGQPMASEAAVVLLRKGYDLQNQGRTTAARQAFEAARLRDGGNAEVGRALADLDAAPRYSAYSREEQVVRKPRQQPQEQAADASQASRQASSATVVTIGDTARASVLLEEGYVALADNGDTALAIAKYEEACRITGTGTSCHQRAAAKLQKLGRRAPSPAAAAPTPQPARPEDAAAAQVGSRTEPAARSQVSGPAGEADLGTSTADYRTITDPVLRKKLAKELYWEGFGLLNDNEDTAAAVEKFRLVREVVPEASFEFNKKATECLRRLRKL